MDCQTATELLLEAEPDELRGASDSALAAHLCGCTDCRTRAGVVMREQGRLQHALNALSTPSATSTRPGSRRAAWLMWPLTAAAALALLFGRGVVRDREVLPPLLLPAARIADVPVVNAVADGNVAVMRTSDPRITVVWYY